ncbi:hypothetical protein Tco_0617135 [Tanacetum coccineum]
MRDVKSNLSLILVASSGWALLCFLAVPGQMDPLLVAKLCTLRTMKEKDDLVVLGTVATGKYQFSSFKPADEANSAFRTFCILKGRKKSWGLNIGDSCNTGDRGKTVGGAIRAYGGVIGHDFKVDSMEDDWVLGGDQGAEGGSHVSISSGMLGGCLVYKRAMLCLDFHICAQDKNFSSIWAYTTMMLPRLRASIMGEREYVHPWDLVVFDVTISTSRGK